MESPKKITSHQNPLIKRFRLLKEKSRERKKSGLFVIEGRREIDLASRGGYQLETVFLCPDIHPQKETIDIPSEKVIEISKPVYEKLAHRGSTEGVLAIAKVKDHGLDQINLSDCPLVLVAENTEKPGNIGALLRTADAAKLDAVLIAEPKSDIYNPNVIRSSVGCLFTTQVAIGSSEEIISFLKVRKINIYGAALTASKNYVEMDFTLPTAIVVGSESDGLTEKWLDSTDENIIIPMQGEIDSMNVSVSAAILIFEAKRQRAF